MISWRNPARKHGDWDLDTYAARVLPGDRASPRASPALSRREHDRLLRRRHHHHGVLNHLAATSDDACISASFAVTLLDFGSRAPIGAFSRRGLLGLARRTSTAPA